MQKLNMPNYQAFIKDFRRSVKDDAVTVHPNRLEKSTALFDRRAFYERRKRLVNTSEFDAVKLTPVEAFDRRAYLYEIEATKSMNAVKSQIISDTIDNHEKK